MKRWLWFLLGFTTLSPKNSSQEIIYGWKRFILMFFLLQIDNYNKYPNVKSRWIYGYCYRWFQASNNEIKRQLKTCISAGALPYDTIHTPPWKDWSHAEPHPQRGVLHLRTTIGNVQFGNVWRSSSLHFIDNNVVMEARPKFLLGEECALWGMDGFVVFLTANIPSKGGRLLLVVD